MWRWRNSLITATVIFGAYLLLNMAFLSKMYMRDSVDYARLLNDSLAQGAVPQIHSDHLLYPPLAFLFLRLTRAFGYTGESIVPLQLLSLIAGAAGVSLFFLLIRSVTGDGLTSIAASAFLAFSYGYWRYSMEAMPYIFAAFFSIATLFAAIAVFKYPKPHHRIPLTVGLAIASTLAFLFQLSLILLVSAIMLMLVIVERQQNRVWGRLRGVAIYSLTVTVVLAISLLGVYATSSNFSLQNLVEVPLEYMRMPGRGATRDVGTPSLLSFGKMPLGLGNTFVGEFYFQEFLATTPYMRTMFTFLAAGFSQAVSGIQISNLGYIVLFGLLGVTAVGFVLFAVYFVVFGKRLWRTSRIEVILCVIWITLMGAFAFWLMPENRQHWMMILTPISVLFALTVRDVKENLGGTKARIGCLFLSVFLISFFSVNFFGSVLPMHRVENNRNLYLTQMIQKYVDRDDMVVCLEAGNLKNITVYIRYFVGATAYPARAIVLEPERKEQTTSWIDQFLQGNRKIYLLNDVFDNDLGYAQLSKYTGLTSEQIALEIEDFFSKYERVSTITFEGKPLLYQITLPAESK